MYMEDPELVTDSSSDYEGYVIFDSTATNDRERTCQVVRRELGVYMYSMRWADTWPTGQHDLDFVITGRLSDPSGFFSSAFTRSADTEQFARAYPVRRTVKLSIGSQGLCLRIRVNEDDAGEHEAPEWIQFQILVGTDSALTGGVMWDSDLDGHSIGNPASSDHAGLLAVGARDLRLSNPAILNYSSRGPVFTLGDDLTVDDASRIKPDAAAGSRAATHTKWNHECGQDASTCGEDLYFGGTSAATGHTAGLAALVVEWLDAAGVSSGGHAVAEYLRGIAVDQGDAGPDNLWGQGFLELPCPSEVVSSLPFTSSGQSWSSGDCDSERRSGSKADYYLLTLDQSTRVEINLESSNGDPYLYLVEGLHPRRTALTFDDDGGDSGYDSKIDIQLDAGSYTIEATTYGSNDLEDYTLKVEEVPVAAVVTASLSPDPATVSFTDDEAWHRFTVSSSVPINVVANPTGEDRRIEISNSDPGVSYCGPEAEDSRERTNRDSVYLSACSAGTGVVELRDASDGAVITSYSITVAAATPAPSPAVCEPVTGFSTSRSSTGTVTLTWTNSTGGLTATGREIDIRKRVSGAWTFERTINEGADSTRAYHIGGDASSSYAYRMRSVCGSQVYSTWTSFSVESPVSGSGSNSDRGRPGRRSDGFTPKPTPGSPGENVGEKVPGEVPPDPQ